MSGMLIAVVAALVLSRAAPGFAASLRRYDWFRAWLRWLGARLGPGRFWHGDAALAAALLPPLVVAGLLQHAFDDPWFGLFGLLFDIAVLAHAWGPRDLDADVEAVASARDPARRRSAAARLWPDGQAPVLEGGALVEAVFRSALRRWFGVLLWFALLGPAGALLYRLTALCAHDDAGAALPEAPRRAARRLLSVLDWPAAQLMTLSLALVGNFDTVLGAWRDAGGASLRLDRDFLGAAARASVRCELAEEAREDAEDFAHESGHELPPPLPRADFELPELRDALSLAWRCLLVWLVVIALFVIAGWVS